MSKRKKVTLKLRLLHAQGKVTSCRPGDGKNKAGNEISCPPGCAPGLGFAAEGASQHSPGTETTPCPSQLHPTNAPSGLMCPSVGSGDPQACTSPRWGNLGDVRQP